MKRLDEVTIACYELENSALTKLATKTASELQSPILVYRTNFRSNLSLQEVLVAHHQSPEEFCL